MNDNPQPEPIIVPPFTFRQFRGQLGVIYTPDYTGMTGAVLDLEEMERLEALIQFIRNAPKGAAQ